MDVKNNIYRTKKIIQPIGTKNSANRREFSSPQKWISSHLKQCVSPLYPPLYLPVSVSLNLPFLVYLYYLYHCLYVLLPPHLPFSPLPLSFSPVLSACKPAHVGSILGLKRVHIVWRWGVKKCRNEALQLMLAWKAVKRGGRTGYKKNKERFYVPENKEMFIVRHTSRITRRVSLF